MMTIEADHETMQGFLKAEIFSGIPSWCTITYQGMYSPKLLRFEVTEDNKVRPFYLATVVSRNEKITWQSFQDLLGRAVDLAQNGMTGLFGLEVLSVDIQNAIRHFNVTDFSQLLINHSKMENATFKTLIRYGQIFCLLHKRAPADWGKVELKTHVEIVDPGKIRPGFFLKRMLRKSGPGNDGAIYEIHDLSVNALWNMEERLPDVVVSCGTSEVYYFHHSFKAARRFIPAIC